MWRSVSTSIKNFSDKPQNIFSKASVQNSATVSNWCILQQDFTILPPEHTSAISWCGFVKVAMKNSQKRSQVPKEFGKGVFLGSICVVEARKIVTDDKYSPWGRAYKNQSADSDSDSDSLYFKNSDSDSD